MPIATPMPALPPAPTAAATASTVALIAFVPVAVSEMPVWLVTTLSSMCAFVCEVTEFSATAPAPAIATPVEPPIPTASEAAAETTSIVGAETVKVPPESVITNERQIPG